MQTNAEHQVYAGFFVRLTAFLVDMIIVNAVLLFIRIPMWILNMNSPDNILTRDFIFQYSIVNIICYLLTVGYFVLMTYYTGSTLGKKLFQIRVVSVENRDMTFFEVLYRESIGRFLSEVILNLGYLLILAQKEHRGVHDLLSDTCVIYYHEKKVYVHTQMNYRNMAPKPGYIVPPSANAGVQSANVPSSVQNAEAQPGNVPPFVQNTGAQSGNVPPFVQNAEVQPGNEPSFVQNAGAQSGNEPPFVQNAEAQPGNMPSSMQSVGERMENMPSSMQNEREQLEDAVPQQRAEVQLENISSQQNVTAQKDDNIPSEPHFEASDNFKDH